MLTLFLVDSDMVSMMRVVITVIHGRAFWRRRAVTSRSYGGNTLRQDGKASEQQ